MSCDAGEDHGRLEGVGESEAAAHGSDAGVHRGDAHPTLRGHDDLCEGV